MSDAGQFRADDVAHLARIGDALHEGMAIEDERDAHAEQPACGRVIGDRAELFIDRDALETMGITLRSVVDDMLGQQGLERKRIGTERALVTPPDDFIGNKVAAINRKFGGPFT